MGITKLIIAGFIYVEMFDLRYFRFPKKPVCPWSSANHLYL